MPSDTCGKCPVSPIYLDRSLKSLVLVSPSRSLKMASPLRRYTPNGLVRSVPSRCFALEGFAANAAVRRNNSNTTGTQPAAMPGSAGYQEKELNPDSWTTIMDS